VECAGHSEIVFAQLGFLDLQVAAQEGLGLGKLLLGAVELGQGEETHGDVGVVLAQMGLIDLQTASVQGLRLSIFPRVAIRQAGDAQ